MKIFNFWAEVDKEVKPEAARVAFSTTTTPRIYLGWSVGVCTYRHPYAWTKGRSLSGPFVDVTIRGIDSDAAMKTLLADLERLGVKATRVGKISGETGEVKFEEAKC